MYPRNKNTSLNHRATKAQRHTGIFITIFLRATPCLPASVVQNLLMYLTRKMKGNLRVIRPFRIQKPFTLR